MRDEARELRDALDGLEYAFDATFDAEPVETRRARDRAQRKHEAIRNRRDEQSFRRPPVAGPAELDRRSRLQRLESR
jgi:hypothetical protein